MICGLEVRSQVSAILHLSNLPPTTSSWVDHVYTCVYHLAAGPLTLSVQEPADTASAGAYFNASRQRLAANRQLSGLGQLAYAAPTGSVVVLKDNKPFGSTLPRCPVRSASHPCWAPIWPLNSPSRSWAVGPVPSLVAPVDRPYMPAGLPSCAVGAAASDDGEY
jgi:hypothetical protein